MPLDPFVTLGVTPTTSDRDVRRAYLRCARATHPDHGGSARAFADVRTSYELLRTAHDRAVFLRTYQPVAATTTTTGYVDVKHSNDLGWYFFGSFLTFVILVATSCARGFGLLRHDAVPAGSHLLLGNFVLRGTYWSSRMAFGHMGFLGALLLGLGLSFVVALPWGGRLRYFSSVEPREVVGYALVLAVNFSLQRTFFPSWYSFLVDALLVTLWFSWASHKDSQALVLFKKETQATRKKFYA